MSSGNATIKSNIVPGFFGLVVCGGKSSRMGSDKSMLIYNGKEQRYLLYDMLEPFCEKVLISCNPKQARGIPVKYPVVTDLEKYMDSGPATALLSAFSVCPGKDILVVGCDYPFIKDRDIADLLSFTSDKRTTAFYNADADLYEPLLAYYSCADASLLRDMHASGEYSLQYFLKMVNGGKFYPSNLRSIQSVDTEEDYITSKKTIRTQNEL